ncbi:MAG: hypothetical protein EPO01_16335 [Aquabacterium sp.]|jgi:hypothetical protein|nr:MAG: hypothetical protein EPO12_02530 [Aquabacterium sp.]TAL18011.1 MAG: hypothetical protein EPO01_16335 [Aquabacterium sp.]
MSEPAAIPLEFVHYPDDADPVVVAKADLLPDGRLKLTAARDSHRNKLGQAIADINAQEGLHLEIAPPEGAPKFAVASRLVERGDEDYLDALQDYFRKYYKLEVEDVREV